VEKLPIPVKKCPQETRAEAQHGQASRYKSKGALSKTQMTASSADKTQFPGFHRKRLAAAEPAPVEIKAEYEEQIQLVRMPAPAVEVRIYRAVKRQRRHKGNGKKQQGFVDQRHEPPAESCFLELLLPVQFCHGD